MSQYAGHRQCESAEIQVACRPGRWSRTCAAGSPSGRATAGMWPRTWPESCRLILPCSGPGSLPVPCLTVVMLVTGTRGDVQASGALLPMTVGCSALALKPAEARAPCACSLRHACRLYMQIAGLRLLTVLSGLLPDQQAGCNSDGGGSQHLGVMCTSCLNCSRCVRAACPDTHWKVRVQKIMSPAGLRSVRAPCPQCFGNAVC